MHEHPKLYSAKRPLGRLRGIAQTLGGIQKTSWRQSLAPLAQQNLSGVTEELEGIYSVNIMKNE